MATLCITIIALVLVGITVGVGKSSDQNTIGKVTTNYYYLLLHITGREDQSVVILRRKQVGNPKGFFDKNFVDYRAGFESRGESHLQNATLDSISVSFCFSLKT